MTGSIGGVPAIPEINSSTSAQKLQVTEDQLVAAYNRVENLIATNPKKQTELQTSLNLIAENFNKIVNIKYGLSSQSVVDSLSTDQIDALTAQIAALTDQINVIVDDINTQTQAIANYQNQITILNQKILTDQAGLNNATSVVTQDLSNAWTAMKRTSPAGIDFQNMVINPWLSSVASGNPDVTALQSNINAFLAKDSSQIKAFRISGILLTTYISSNIIGDSHAVPPLLSQLQNDNAQLNVLNQALQTAQNQLDSDNAALAVLQTQLDSLNSQLQAAQTVLNQAIAFFDSLTPDEKTLFRELFPDVTFPA